MRPCLSKSVEKFLKSSSSDNLSAYVTSKMYFALQRKILRAHSNASYILKQCIKTFQMSYQRPLYALFHPDPPKFHYFIKLEVNFLRKGGKPILRGEVVRKGIIKKTFNLDSVLDIIPSWAAFKHFCSESKSCMLLRDSHG